MAVYKDGKTWKCNYSYVDVFGKRRFTTKRGFATKREASAYEHEVKLNDASDANFAEFAEIYYRDKSHELKPRTIENKKYIVDKHIVPFFGGMKISGITPADIIEWQRNMIDKGYSESYLRICNNALTSIMNHAQNVYSIRANAAKKVKKMGRTNVKKMNFWTKDEYTLFIKTFDNNSWHLPFFEILFWTGMRVGEALALTYADFSDDEVSVSKTYYRRHKTDTISTPKTEGSVRTISIPRFLKEEVDEYYHKLYKYPADERLFPVTIEAVQHVMKYHIGLVPGLKMIRVHDLRHSHVAFLISQSVEIVLIKQRLGHSDIRMTINTYGHLYPSKQRGVADLLDKINRDSDA